MGRRRTIARPRRSHWTSLRKNHGLDLNRRRVARRNLDPSHPVETRRHVDLDLQLRNPGDLAPSRDPEDLIPSPEDQSRTRKIAASPGAASPSRQGHDRAHILRSRGPRATIAARRGNRDPTRATRDPPSLARNRRTSGKTTSVPTGNAMVVRAAPRNPRRRKVQRTRTISRYERRRMAYKPSDLIGKLIRMTAAAIATPVARESRLLRGGALHRAKIGDAPKRETATGADRATDHEIDHEIGRAIDRATGTGGNIGKFVSSFSSLIFSRVI